jgi:hypothetical protein
VIARIANYGCAGIYDVRGANIKESLCGFTYHWK